MPGKIPKGVILDLLDLYDLNIQIVYVFFEDMQNVPPKLNSYSIEVTREIYSIAAKWRIEFEGLTPRKWERDFDVPFHFDGDLTMEIAFRSQYPGTFKEDGLCLSETMEQMHATHRLIKDLLRSERVSTDEVGRDSAVQDIIIETKRVLSELKAKRVDVIRSQDEQRKAKATISKTRLEGKQIEFDDEQPAILIDGERFVFVRLNKDYCFVRAMFDLPLKESEDWNKVLTTMEEYLSPVPGTLYGHRATDVKKHESLRKLANRVSKRIQDGLNTGDFLFTATDGSFTRNFGPP